MFPIFAFLFCTFFVIILLKIDVKLHNDAFTETLIPFAWLIIAGSKYLSHWIGYGQTFGTESAFTEGSPVDRYYFLMLTIAGIYLLIKRKAILLNVIINNKIFSIFLLYGLVSIFWSEIPFSALKRFIKYLGNVIVALVILSECNPVEVLTNVLRRVAIVLLPFSVIFIKYFPQIGREYSVTGGTMYRGVTGQKNELGLICIFFGIIFIWNLLKIYKEHNSYDKKKIIYIYITLLILNIWLLIVSNSATSLFCFSVGSIILFFGNLNYFNNNRTRVCIYLSVIVIFAILLQYMFNIKSDIIQILGRDDSLTTRTPMWDFMLGMKTNPLFGTGFESFLTLDRMQLIRSYYGVSSPHNAYLNTYLNLGAFGLLLLIMIYINTYFNIYREMSKKYYESIFKLTLLIIIVMYGYTEAYIFGVNFISFGLCFISIKYDT